ncbi:NUDIX domain-containing protein [Streptomyces sp. NPDC017941]|uniref:NUDIX domain-containing protein n=1 Tax=Streptomyces sp. NPDC017941 TaxID=3365018 RepID=UPI0037BD34B8
MERANTGYADGLLCPLRGHLADGESVPQGAVRESAEEVGVHITHADLEVVHVVHRRNDGPARIGFLFLVHTWCGRPYNRELDKCAGLLWADPDAPPSNTVPYTAATLA